MREPPTEWLALRAGVSADGAVTVQSAADVRTVAAREIPSSLAGDGVAVLSVVVPARGAAAVACAV